MLFLLNHRLITAAFILLSMAFSSVASAQALIFGITPQTPSPQPIYDQRFENADSKVLKTRVIYERRTDTPTKSQVWQQLLTQLEDKTGLSFTLVIADSQLAFERALAQGKFDLAYLTPLQFLSAIESQGYKALAKRKAQPLRSLIVVKRLDKAKTLRDIETSVTGFDSLLDYTSSVIPRYSLKRLGFALPMRLYPDTKQLEMALTEGKVRAISLAESDFYALSPDRQEQLKILWETPGFSPFAFATHPRVPFYSINKLQRAMVNLNRRGNNAELLQALEARNGFEVARNSDWIDARDINVQELNMHLPLAEPAQE